jgi:hypothetical protein
MNRKILGIFYDPWNREPLPERNLIELYHKGFQYKANPRDESYMNTLFTEHFPGAPLVYPQKNQAWGEILDGADSIVLLYPDAIGLGYSKIEKLVFKKKGASAVVKVLNGRRRLFTLTSGILPQLRWRRFLERFMVCEFLFTGIFLLVTPVFLLVDFVRGKR